MTPGCKMGFCRADIVLQLAIRCWLGMQYGRLDIRPQMGEHPAKNVVPVLQQQWSDFDTCTKIVHPPGARLGTNV